MAEVLFYHLTTHRLERALPALVERTVERSWRAVVRTVSEERAIELSDLLWTFRPDAFVPNAHAGDDLEPEPQPVWITVEDDAPNEADVRFVVDSASPPDEVDVERLVLMFDGDDEDAVSAARRHWKTFRDAGHTLTYWQQDEGGRWSKKG